MAWPPTAWDETGGSCYFQIDSSTGPAPSTRVPPHAVFEFSVNAEDALHIGWENGYRNMNWIREGPVAAPGTFYYEQPRTSRGLLMPPRIRFEPEPPVKGEASSYSDKQYWLVGDRIRRALGLEKDTACDDVVKVHFAVGDCTVLVRHGNVLPGQLKQILKDRGIPSGVIRGLELDSEAP